MQRIAFQDDDILKDSFVAHGACTLFEKDALLKKGGYDSDLECQDGFDLWMKVALDNQGTEIVNSCFILLSTTS